jgi:hypothetical protein
MLDAGTTLLIVLIGAIVIAGNLVARTYARMDRSETAVVAGLTALVAIPSFLQLAIWPWLETSLGRDEGKIAHHGQIWRISTSVVVQDGGWPGAISNVSVGNCGIAAALLVYAVVLASHPWRLAAGALVAIGCTLLVHRDIHGAAFVTSTIVLLAWRLLWVADAEAFGSPSPGGRERGLG